MRLVIRSSVSVGTDMFARYVIASSCCSSLFKGGYKGCEMEAFVGKRVLKYNSCKIRLTFAVGIVYKIAVYYMVGARC